MPALGIGAAVMGMGATKRGLRAGVVLLWLAIALPATAQQIVLDDPVRAGDLLAFSVVGDDTKFYYAPVKARLATGPNGKPQFSFLRYVENVNDPNAKLAEGHGGGILHAVVQLGMTEQEVADGRAELRRLRPGAELVGPVVFQSGRFGLVSSFADENGDLTTSVVGLGTAPVLDGGKAAVSMQLTRQGAKILWQSFQSATPDISFKFEMEMAGYRAPRRAIVEADLDRVYEHRAFEAGIATTYLQAEISQAMDDLQQQGAIRLTQVGDDEDLEALAQTAYSKLTELVFQPAGAELQAQIQQAGGAGRKSALDRASELLEKRREEVRAANERRRQERMVYNRLAQQALERPNVQHDERTKRLLQFFVQNNQRAEQAPPEPEREPEPDEELPEFAAVVTYEMKRQRQRGTYRVDLNKYTADTLQLRFDENVGDLRRMLDDESIFRSVNLDDPLYQQREISASLLGIGAKDFEDVLAFVNVKIRKTHQNGEQTLREERISRDLFNERGNAFKLVYGWKGDDDRARWEQFEYRTLWAFHDAPPVETDWEASSFSGLALVPPFERRTVQLEALDGSVLEDAGVRSITVRFTNELFGKTQVEQVTLNSARGELSKQAGFLVPKDATEYGYEIQWRLRGNRTITTGPQRTTQDILYVDELPET